jgi:membrane-bound lytic murein transglycosylase B
LLLPSGHTGPAFLVGPNYQVILSWNRSEFYALSVGYLADRIQGARPMQTLPPALPPLRFDAIRTLQKRLGEAGFDAGPADGILGSGTRAALRRWQASQGLIADGYPNATVFERLNIGAP